LNQNGIKQRNKKQYEKQEKSVGGVFLFSPSKRRNKGDES
jgi:hypothetical protein